MLFVHGQWSARPGAVRSAPSAVSERASPVRSSSSADASFGRCNIPLVSAASCLLLSAVTRRAVSTEKKPPNARGTAKPLRRSAGALRKWGGAGFKVREDGLALRPKPGFQQNKVVATKWRPKRENWEAWVTDDEGEAFGALQVGHEVEVLRARNWVPGVVTYLNQTDEGYQAKLSLSTGFSAMAVVGRGLLRRQEDASELCTESDLARMAKLRALNQPKELMKYGMQLDTVAGRSQAIYSLVGMGPPGIKRAEEMVAALKTRDVASTALRELCHAHARFGNIQATLKHLEPFDEVHAAQLLLEVLALGLTGTILKEREKRDSSDNLSGVETNKEVQRAVAEVVEHIPKLGPWAEKVRLLPTPNRQQCFTEPFNELLLSCGRAHAVKLSFRVLEWMEALTIPKNSFTYEAIGVNVVKRITRLKKVWDLPQAPEDNACPEVVFAGRSNVGKSSLVNMLLNRSALAPTSTRPGRTKTMDFFDVNHGHPALPRFRMVDVPGLGFARVSRELRERWIGLIGGYFVQRQSLKIVFHLLDAGLCELMPADRELWRLLAQARRSDYELCIVLTKADNSVPVQLERFAGIVREALRREGSDLAVRAKIFACSSVTKLGKDTLWRKIWAAVGGEQSAVADLGEGPDNAERYRKTEFGAEPASRSGS